MSTFDININFGVFGLFVWFVQNHGWGCKKVCLYANVFTNLFITFVKEHNHERGVVVNV